MKQRAVPLTLEEARARAMTVAASLSALEKRVVREYLQLPILTVRQLQDDYKKMQQELRRLDRLILKLMTKEQDARI